MGGILPQDLKIYQVINTITGEKCFQVADNAQQACLQAGWQVVQCEVDPLVPRHHASPGQSTELRVKIPTLTCPFQYSSCNRPPDVECGLSPNAPELAEWLKQATAAHLCAHQGQTLIYKDHTLGQKWVTIPEAIKELAPQHLSDALNAP